MTKHLYGRVVRRTRYNRLGLKKRQPSSKQRLEMNVRAPDEKRPKQVRY